MKLIFTLFFSFIVISNLCALEIKPSKLDESKRKSRRRDRAMGEWHKRAETQSIFDKKVKRNQMVIFSEVKEFGQTRFMFIQRVNGVSFCTRNYRTQKTVLGYHDQYSKEGYILLTLHLYVDNSGKEFYSATWINKSGLKRSLRKLHKLGISQGHVQLD